MMISIYRLLSFAFLHLTKKKAQRTTSSDEFCQSMRHDVILLFFFEAGKRIGYVDVCRMAGRHKNEGSGGKTNDGKIGKQKGATTASIVDKVSFN